MNKQDELTERFLGKLQSPLCYQVNAALMYSELLFMVKGTEPVWAIINSAIIEKWSKSGLVKIKTMAWQLHEGSHLTLVNR